MLWKKNFNLLQIYTYMLHVYTNNTQTTKKYKILCCFPNQNKTRKSSFSYYHKISFARLNTDCLHLSVFLSFKNQNKKL